MPFARHAVAIPALVLVACTSTDAKQERLDPALIEHHEENLMKPFRTGHTVVCRRLSVEANPLFFKHLTFPAGKPRKRGVDGGQELTWSTADRVSIRGPKDRSAQVVIGGVRNTVDKFRIMVGSTTFMVDDLVTVRSLNRAAPTLTALASGHVMVIQDGKNASSFQQVRYIDGRIEAR